MHHSLIFIIICSYSQESLKNYYYTLEKGVRIPLHIGIQLCCFRYPLYHQNKQWHCMDFPENKTFATALRGVTPHWYSSLSSRQAIMECASGTLKFILKKQRGGMCVETPESRVAKVICTLNH